MVTILTLVTITSSLSKLVSSKIYETVVSDQLFAYNQSEGLVGDRLNGFCLRLPMNKMLVFTLHSQSAVIEKERNMPDLFRNTKSLRQK